MSIVALSLPALSAGDYIKLIPFGLLAPLAASALWRFRRLHRGRRILRFAWRAKLDVVVTTSETAAAAPGIRAKRNLTGYGQVRGFASCAEAMARLYSSKKKIPLHFSAAVRGSLDGDLLLLGGPSKNRETRRFLDHFRQLITSPSSGSTTWVVPKVAIPGMRGPYTGTSASTFRVTRPMS